MTQPLPELSTLSPFPADTTVAVVGVGLIGGSIAAALKSRQHRGRVIGIGRAVDRLEAAAQAGLLDDIATDPTRIQAGLWIVCTPVDRIAADVRAIAAAASSGTLITDAGSVKGPICRALENLPGGATFLGSHPLAGSEQRGFEHARADLFQGRTCVITPPDDAPSEAVHRLTAFWKSLGMHVVRMTPENHDESLAYTSHTPHAVAAALAAALTDSERPLTATGFADTTRIAAGDPDLWAAIFLQNADALERGLSRFAGRLDTIRRAIATRDAAALKNLLRAAKTNRDAITSGEPAQSGEPRAESGEPESAAANRLGPTKQ
jgi:prephenate dehydrogenase